MKASSSQRTAAWAVHAYTASGVALAFAALLAIMSGDFRAAFFWLFVTTAIDATDGALARMVDVKRRLPEIDGAHLDDIVDYLTFVFVPLALLHQAGVLVGSVGIAAAVLALLTSALRFCHAEAKTADHFFTGFPSYWNVVAFYFFLLPPPPLVAAALIGALALLVLAPIRFVYPSRMTTLRAPTVLLGVLWGAVVLVLLWQLPERSPVLTGLSLLYPAYYTGVSLYLDRGRGGRSPPAPRCPDGRGGTAGERGRATLSSAATR